MTLTAIDFFCGAGGSSTGLVKAGLEVKFAANHWQLAIETHSTNHPATEHDIADLQETHASRYPRTDIAWFSPECTNHSGAKGKRRKSPNQLDLWGEHKIDPAEERSRATMREVVEFSAWHRYDVVIVENVVEIRYWQHYEAWLNAMLNLGYEFKGLYLNAQFFGVPQSRDRFYGVFWRKGIRPPNLDFRPPAMCQKHGQVSAVQSFKKPDYHWGRYGSRRQYVYVCPQCGAMVEPFYRPASTVIDWALSSEKIGNRKKPLEPKTIQRIMAGLRKFGGTVATDDTAQPFIHSYYTRDDANSSIDAPVPTIPTENRHSLITPPFMVILKNSHSKDGTYTLPPRGLDEPLTTVVASASQHALVTPPFLVEPGGVWERGEHSLDKPLPTQLTRPSLALVTPFIASYYGTDTLRTVDQPLPTIPTVDHHALITPEQLLPECGFRMLEPHELKAGMSFPGEYIILGNKRNQVKQIGNAVACNVAQWIGERCVEALS